MRKIICLFFTFLGICNALATVQINPAVLGNALAVQINDTLPAPKDSATGMLLTKIFPNPARNKVEIEIRGFEPGYITIQLLTANGTVIRAEKRMVITGNETVLFMFFEKPGIYYIAARQGKRLTKNKLIVQ